MTYNVEVKFINKSDSEDWEEIFYDISSIHFEPNGSVVLRKERIGIVAVISAGTFYSVEMLDK